jgi:hypothetical protein
MPEANIFEKTKLILKAKISRGKARNEQATWTIKNQGSGEEKKIKVKIGKDATDVTCEYETPEVPDGKESYLINYELEADGRKFAGAYPYRVWPHYFNMKAVGKDGKAFPGFPFKVKQAGAPATEKSKAPQTGGDGTLRVDLKVTGAVAVEAVSPFLIDKWTAGKDKGRNLEAHVSRKPFTAAIYAPADKDVKQYVNLPPGRMAGYNGGSRLKVQVGPKEDKGKAPADRAGMKDDEIFVQVVFSDKNSKRNEPKPRLIVDGSDVAPEADKRTFKSKVKLGEGGNPADFIVELGYAGGDACEIKVGVTAACEDDKIKVTTWRKLGLEIIQPKPECSSYTVFKSDKSDGLADDQANAIKKELGKVFIEMDCAKNIAPYAKADLAGRAPYLVFDAAYFQRDPGKKMVMLSDQHFQDLRDSKASSNPQPKMSLVTAWADYYSDASNVQLTAFLDSSSSTEEIQAPKGVFEFDPIKADGSMGIQKFTWWTSQYMKDGQWADIQNPGDPGYDKSTAQQEVTASWDELQHFIQFVHYRKIIIKLPKRAGKEATDPGFFLTQGGKRVRIGVKIVFAGAEFTANAGGWHGWINMSTYGGKFKTGGLVATLLHELGHNLGQAYAGKTVDPTYGRTDANAIPGIPFPPGVAEGFVYGGHGHTGTHCVTGVRRNNRANASYTEPNQSAVAIQNEATCIMFGSGDMNDAKLKEFCEDCRTYIRATEAHNITKVWDK